MKEKNENKASRAKIDPALVAQARTGDQSAFTALYEQTHTALYRSIRSMVHDEDLAWDILQDCYLKAFQGLDKLEADGAFLTWLRRIAVNETAHQMSKRLPVTFTELGDEEDDSQPELPDLNPDVQPELALDRQETSRLVREILAELPEQQQLIVGMRYYEDLSIKEIAELLHLTPGTIKTQLHFGRKKVETKVRALEKQGLKLYGLAPFPFLLALLRNLEPGEAAGRMVRDTVLAQTPAAATAAAGSTASVSAAGAEAVKLTAMTAGQALRHGLGAKLTAGALALCMIGGGVWAGGKALSRETPDIGDQRLSVTETERPTREPTDVTAEYIQTEEPTKPGEADSQLSFDTAESAYDYVLDQYRQALADPDFTAVAYPLVNADTVSKMAKRWSRYTNDEVLYAIYQDIDGNGIQELIVLQPRADEVYEYGNKSICAIYTWNGSLPVELLGEIGYENDDLLTIYDSGLIRCVKNAYLTNPAQVTEYRLDAERAALQEQRQWTYRCTEQGEHSYQSVDGTLLTPEEFYADCGKPVDLSYSYWDEEAKESRERGTVVASNPGTAEAGPVKDWEDLPEGKGEYYQLPQITLEGEAFENFNREMQREFLTEGGKYFEDTAVVYDWTLNDDILCVYISDAHAGYFPFEYRYFSISEARELTEDEMLLRRGVDRAKLEAGLTDALYGAFFNEFDHEVYIAGGLTYREYLDYLLEATPGYKDSASYVLDRSGRLVCIAKVASMAGGECYYHMLPVLWLD